MIDYNTLALEVENRPRALRRHEHVYDGAAGEPLHRTMRVEYSDSSKRVWQQRYAEGTWENGLGDVETVLYRLPQVLEKASTGGLVLLVEGERVVEAIEALGITATTSPMGAGKWRDNFARALRGAYVVLCPDCDLEGRKHTVHAGRSLLEAGVAVFGPLELGVDDQQGTDLLDYVAACAETLRAVSPELDRMTVRNRLRQLMLRAVRQCLPATHESLADYLERAEWRVNPKGREIRHCERCKRDRPHTLTAGVLYCPCGGLQV